MINKLLIAFFVLILSATSCPGGWGVTCLNFRRGDTNGDGQVDLSDGIATLTFLFNGGERPGCADAADADDSGNIDLSDGIYTFQYLFIGGAPLPPPGPMSVAKTPLRSTTWGVKMSDPADRRNLRGTIRTLIDSSCTILRGSVSARRSTASSRQPLLPNSMATTGSR